MKQPATTLAPTNLLKEGFALESIFDRDAVDDTYDTLRVDIYTKAITEGVALEVTHCHSLSADGVATHMDTSVAVVITECYAPLAVTSLDELRIMTGDLSRIFKNQNT